MKIVGTPYTVYLGRNLYNTFMDAYTLVDSPTRKAMEGMLKTWKEPVPGSIDTRPVFSSDVTRAIENALIKARTAAIQHQQSQARQQQQSLSPYVATPHAAGLWRSTPTPPQKFVQHQVASNLPSFGSQQSSGQTPTVGYVISLYIGIGSNKSIDASTHPSGTDAFSRTTRRAANWISVTKFRCIRRFPKFVSRCRKPNINC